MNPWLKIDIGGITVQLQINGYRPSDKKTWDDQWCNVGFSFSSYDQLDYHCYDSEILLSCEVEELAEKAAKLLNNELSGKTEIEFTEPDFNFLLYPKSDLYEVTDCKMEWIVTFRNEGYFTDNYLSVGLSGKDIQLLLNYLLLITGKLKSDSDVIVKMINDGFIYG